MDPYDWRTWLTLLAAVFVYLVAFRIVFAGGYGLFRSISYVFMSLTAMGKDLTALPDGLDQLPLRKVTLTTCNGAEV